MFRRSGNRTQSIRFSGLGDLSDLNYIGQES